MISLREAGLGLEYGHLELAVVTADWVDIGHELAGEVASTLGLLVHAVEHIGSTAVTGLLAKPIVDLALGYTAAATRGEVESALAGHGWAFRGDAGAEGGHIYVLEAEPAVRVAHAHGVAHAGPQWNRYIEFRDLLRCDPSARQAYAETKARLLGDLTGNDVRKRYTDQKTPVVNSLLRGLAD